MDRSPITPDAVSKLKKAAKLRVRSHPNLDHAQALDEVAKDAGYHHWKHVTECASAPAHQSPLARLTGAALVENPERYRRQELIVIVGPPGSGKTLRATDYALNALRNGLTVHILEVGRSYRNLVQQVGGALLSVGPDGAVDTEVFGKEKLLVLDLENSSLTGPVPAFPTITESLSVGAPGLLIVDEVSFVCRTFGGADSVGRFVEGYLAAGGSVLLLGQDVSEVKAPAPERPPSGVHCAMVRLSSIP